MRTSRRPAAAAAALALGLAVLAAVASGCSYASPAIITTPYAASDGTNAELGTVKFRNFLIVSEAKGKPGVVVGAVTTDGGEPVPVQLSVLEAPSGTALAQARVMVQPGRLAGIGNGEEAVHLQVESVPVLPGAVLRLHAQTPAGRIEFSVPVVPLTNEYRTLTPAPPSSPSSTPSSSAATPSGSPTSSPGTSPAEPATSGSPAAGSPSS